MGTRGLTIIHSEWNQKQRLVCLYRQYDSYPSGHGAGLSQFLTSKTIVNGIPCGVPTEGMANGMGCLAAQLVAHFKDDVGGFYLYPTNTKDAGQDYEYHVYYDFRTGIGTVKVIDCSRSMIFKGTWAEFDVWCRQ